MAKYSRVELGAGVTNKQKNLEPESDFKVVFQAVVIVGSKMSN